MVERKLRPFIIERVKGPLYPVLNAGESLVKIMLHDILPIENHDIKYIKPKDLAAILSLLVNNQLGINDGIRVKLRSFFIRRKQHGHLAKLVLSISLDQIA